MLFAALLASLELMTVTNHAGQVLEACPVSITNRIVVFERPSGERVRVPLRTLPETEQRRVSAALGEDAASKPTTRQKRKQLFYQDLLKRNEALHKAGAMEERAYEERRKRLGTILDE